MNGSDRRGLPKQTVIVEGVECALIPLTKGKFAIVDDEDFERINKFNWQFMDGYAAHNHGSKRIHLRMHRVVLNASAGVEVDHWNGNGIDNRKSNLRAATHALNMRNTKLRKNSRTGLKGAHFHKQSGVFRPRVTVNGKAFYLGAFATAELAHEAYCRAASQLHGEFTRTK